jgi:hypothetical protein
VIFIASEVLFLIYKFKPKFGRVLLIGLISAFLILILKGILTSNYRILSLGNQSWIPAPDISSIGRLFYEFLFGVDYHALGYPDYFKVDFISNYQLLFTIVSLSYIAFSSFNLYKLLKNKDFEFTTLFFQIVSLLPFLASYSVLNLFLQRYQVALALIFVIFISVQISKLKISAIILTILIFVILQLNVRWVDTSQDYSRTAWQIQNLTQRVVFKTHIDFLTVKYFLQDSKQIYVQNSDLLKNVKIPFVEKSEIVDEVNSEDLVL